MIIDNLNSNEHRSISQNTERYLRSRKEKYSTWARSTRGKIRNSGGQNFRQTVYRSETKFVDERPKKIVCLLHNGSIPKGCFEGAGRAVDRQIPKRKLWMKKKKLCMLQIFKRMIKTYRPRFVCNKRWVNDTCNDFLLVYVRHVPHFSISKE